MLVFKIFPLFLEGKVQAQVSTMMKIFFQEMKVLLQSAFPNSSASKLEQLLSCGYALLSSESKSIGLPDFPIDNIHYAAKLLTVDPSVDVGSLFSILFPYRSVLTKEGVSAVSNIMKSFRVKATEADINLKIIDKKSIDAEKCVIYLNNNAVIEVSNSMAQVVGLTIGGNPDNGF